MQGTSLGDPQPKRKIGAGLIALLVVGGLVLLAGSVAAGYFLLRPSKGEDVADRYKTLPACTSYAPDIPLPLEPGSRPLPMSPTMTMLDCTWTQDFGTVLTASFKLHTGESGAGRRAAEADYQAKIGDDAMPLAKADRAQTHSAPSEPGWCELDMLQGNVVVNIGGNLDKPCAPAALALATSISNALG